MTDPHITPGQERKTLNRKAWPLAMKDFEDNQHPILCSACCKIFGYTSIYIDDEAETHCLQCLYNATRINSEV